MPPTRPHRMYMVMRYFWPTRPRNDSSCDQYQQYNPCDVRSQTDRSQHNLAHAASNRHVCVNPCISYLNTTLHAFAAERCAAGCLTLLISIFRPPDQQQQSLLRWRLAVSPMLGSTDERTDGQTDTISSHIWCCSHSMWSRLHILCEQHQQVIKTLKTKTYSLYSEKNNASQESVESDLRNENLVNLPSNRSQVQFSIVEPGLDSFLWFSFSTCSRRETSDTSWQILQASCHFCHPTNDVILTSDRTVKLAMKRCGDPGKSITPLRHCRQTV